MIKERNNLIWRAVAGQEAKTPIDSALNQQSGYKTIPFPRLRQLVIDAARVAHDKHTIRCLAEIDVTEARRCLREHRKKTGAPFSFTAFIIAALAQAVEADKNFQAYRDWRNRLFIFDDVDVITYVEIEAEGRKFPINYIIRAANRKSVREIQEEIYAVKNDPAHSPSGQRRRAVSLFLRLPFFIRRLFYRFVNRRPRLWKKYVGTISLSSVGMFGAGGGWGISFSSHTLSVTVGGITEKPAVVRGKIEPREMLDITVDFDHDIVDGAPAARFMRRFKEIIKSGSVIT